MAAWICRTRVAGLDPSKFHRLDSTLRLAASYYFALPETNRGATALLRSRAGTALVDGANVFRTDRYARARHACFAFAADGARRRSAAEIRAGAATSRVSGLCPSTSPHLILSLRKRTTRIDT